MKLALKWTEDEVERLRGYAASGLSLRQIGLIYGLTRSRIHQVMEKHFIENVHKGMISTTLDEFQETNMLAHLNAAAYKDDPRLNRYLNKRAWCNNNGVEFSLEFSDIDWPTHCPILGLELDYSVRYSDSSAEFDRVNPNEGYVLGNVAVISRRANRLKDNGTASEHERIAEFMRSF